MENILAANSIAVVNIGLNLSTSILHALLKENVYIKIRSICKSTGKVIINFTEY